MPRVTDELQNSIGKFAELIESSSRAIVFSGAGISTPSGIADFRTPRTGLWERFDPMEFASLSAFRKHPKKFFRWIQPLLSAALKARPNPAHEAIAQLERDSYLWGVITQNIDGLHKRAGTRNVAEIHGDLSTFSCQACHARVASGKLVQEFNRKEEVPSCASCGGYLKPDIVLFEEPLPEAEWMKAVTMAQRSDLFIVTGSSLEVYPAASLPQVAKENNAKLVINTLLPTGLDAYADLVLRFDVVDIWVGLKRKIYG